jgi:hypothetical protein
MPPEITCPAGSYHERDGAVGVQCKIEDAFIKFRDNPLTVSGWCSGDYHKCPVWIGDKENDPAVARAQGTPKMGKCDACAGTGITRVEELRSGLIITEEYRCDACAGTGRTPL